MHIAEVRGFRIRQLQHQVQVDNRKSVRVFISEHREGVIVTGTTPCPPAEIAYSTATFVPFWPWLDKCSIRSLRISRIALRNSTREFAKCCRTADEIPRHARTVSTISRHGQRS